LVLEESRDLVVDYSTMIGGKPFVMWGKFRAVFGVLFFFFILLQCNSLSVEI